MKGICPSCEKVTKLEHIENEEEIKVRGECIKVNVKYFKCLECGEQFDDPSSDDDPLDKAYREYRIKHAMIQPEEIKELRKQYGLTQKEFSKLLGFGGATISRYENGALQDEVHDKLLQLMKNQENMYKLLLKNEGFFSPGKKDHLLKGIKSAINDSFSFANVLEEKYANYKPCIDSGYNNFDSNKLFNIIKFFTKDGVLKSKLCKLLFYADFKHFKNYSVSITGVRYAHAHFGPVPDNYEHYFAVLIHDYKAIRVEEKLIGEYIGEVFFSDTNPDLSIFSDSEIEVLISVKKHFNEFSASEIREFSHRERGYKDTYDGEIISYEYANYLQI